MNFKKFEFSTKEEGLEKLKDAVLLRNQMGGALYWNIINDNCIEIAVKLENLGVERSELTEIMG